MVQFLKTLPSGQRVALFVLGSRLRMLSGFTTDSAKWVPLSFRSRLPPAACQQNSRNSGSIIDL
jgi:hypothetical protein